MNNAIEPFFKKGDASHILLANTLQCVRDDLKLLRKQIENDEGGRAQF